MGENKTEGMVGEEKSMREAKKSWVVIRKRCFGNFYLYKCIIYIYMVEGKLQWLKSKMKE